MGKVWPRIYQKLHKSLGDNFELDAALADGAGEGMRQTEIAIENEVDTIIAVGGEGTVNEVVNSIYNNDTRVKLGFLRGGTVNDYLRTINWPKSLDHEIDVIARQNYREVPLIRIQGETDIGSVARVGLNAADVGIGAKIAHMASVERRLTWLNGLLRYQLLGIRAVLGWSNKEVRILIEDQIIEGGLSFLTAGFSNYVGGNLVHPHADPLGEKMAYTMAMNFSKLGMIRKMKMLENGDHTPEMENIYMGQTERIDVHLQEQVLFEIDGEPLPHRSDEISIQVMDEKVSILNSD